MAKIPAAKAAAMFEEIIGWPYVSPGTCNQRGIDCSGAWVRVYRAYRKHISHSSNRQFREHCTQTGKISSQGDLHVGMAVFKRREWTTDRKGHRDYLKAPGDMYHVGCVTSIRPLRIVHATPPHAKADTALGNWTHCGMLKEVDYGDLNAGAVPPTANESGAAEAKVITTTSGLRLRKQPDATSAVIRQMPIGTVVKVLDVREPWVQVLYTDARGMVHRGWCSTGVAGTRYLEFGSEDYR